MLRTLIAAASCTLNRLPAFDGPKFLDKPFSSFGAVVNPAVLDGRRAFRAIDIARAMRRVDLHLARAKPRLRSSK